jgi:hypothetical protein
MKVKDLICEILIIIPEKHRKIGKTVIQKRQKK